MRVVFVAPFLLDATVRFVKAVAEVPGCELALITQEPRAKIPAAIAARLKIHYQVADAFDPGVLVAAIKAIAPALGGVDRLLGTLEQLQVPLGVVRDRLGLPGIGEGAARNFRDKGRMKDVLQAAGLPCARHRAVTDVAGALAFVREVGLPVVVKPLEGAAAVATSRVREPAELERALALAPPSPARPVVIEEMIVGEERSFETLSLGGEAFWDSSTIYAPNPLTVLENPWIQWTVLLPRETRRPVVEGFRPIAHAALKALGMVTGISHMEWFRTASGRMVISEVGARPPGAQIMTINSYAHDLDLYRVWAELVVLDRVVRPERRFAVGAAYLRGAGEGRVVAVHGLEEAQRELGHLVVEARLPTLGQAKSSSYEGEGFAILRHPETEVVQAALQRLISLVRVEVRAK
ncbi:MAG: ATP-grasp domain-containing protein [Myxococcales bacterium]|nr:ATP-grasp domain-containing protein [Myxococcales bacterium]